MCFLACWTVELKKCQINIPVRWGKSKSYLHVDGSLTAPVSRLNVGWNGMFRESVQAEAVVVIKFVEIHRYAWSSGRKAHC
jgi:carbonic anhydrase